MEKLCRIFESNVYNNGCLAFVLEQGAGDQPIKHLGSGPRRLQPSNMLEHISLHQVLTALEKLNPIEKRCLAIVLAESLLILHDSPWLDEGWRKSDIWFVRKSNNKRDLTNPFLSVRFNMTEAGSTARTAFHRNPNILALGVLLVEIFNERGIESWSAANTSPYLVAEDIAEKMDPMPSTDAIKACFYLDWIPTGQVAELKHPKVRLGFVEKVIEPLRRELDYVQAKINNRPAPSEDTTRATGVDHSPRRAPTADKSSITTWGSSVASVKQGERPGMPSFYFLAAPLILIISLLFFNPNFYFRTVLISVCITSVWNSLVWVRAARSLKGSHLNTMAERFFRITRCSMRASFQWPGYRV